VGVFVIATKAGDSQTQYYTVDSSCLVKSKLLDDGTVPTFKKVSGVYNGLLVGLPVDAEYKENDRFFEPVAGYTVEYFDKTGKRIDTDGVHLGTTDKVVVYDKNNNIAAQYGLVTYGDAGGDGVFDALDAYIASLCLNGHIEPAEVPDVYEAVKPRLNSDNAEMDANDYSKIVNDVLAVEPDENLKGRKKPVDETISFESIIYACDGKAKTAAVSIPDSNFKKIVAIEYNGSQTAPTTPGIYSITAVIPDETEYLVTPGTKELGFMVVAPKTGTGYETVVDNANKNIIIDISEPNETGADLTGYIKNMVNSAYTMNVNSKSVASSGDLLNALALRGFNYYTTANNIITITEKSITTLDDTTNAALGCYLPDDITLWNNVNAQKTVPVSLFEQASFLCDDRFLQTLVELPLLCV
jgi:hypothetical protein